MVNKVRKNLKIVLIIALAVTLVGSTSAFAWWGMGGGKRGGKGGRHMAKRWIMMNLTPEQAGKVFDLRQKFMTDTAETRKAMLVKGVELAQLWKAEKPDDKAILAKVKELGALRAQFMEKAVAMGLEMRKIVPEAMGRCPMFGPGFGPGHGFGPGPGWGPGFGPGPGKGKGKGKGRGARLNSGSENLAQFEADLDRELAMLLQPRW